MQMPSSTLWTCSFSHPLPIFFSLSKSSCRRWETVLLPLRQAPSISQVELPVTMRQPLETDGLQTACHVYCCCHKRQESNNILPQEAYRIAQGPANSCLRAGGWGAMALYSHSHTHTHTHTLNTLLTLNIQKPSSLSIDTNLQYTDCPGMHSKCSPPTCPDMLHLLQLNKHAI